MLNPDATFALAERVAEEAGRLGFECAMIGAAALAVHGYARGTEDIDLAVAVNPRTQLKALQSALEASGFETDLRLPEDDDPIGGLLTVRAPHAEAPESIDVVEVVNFRNPHRFVATPAPVAIARAEAMAGSSLRCVTIEDLVALKLMRADFPISRTSSNFLHKIPTRTCRPSARRRPSSTARGNSRR